MKINRNLPQGQLEHYASLLGDEEINLPEELGSYHKVSFTGKHALKSPMEDSPESFKRFRKSLFKEYRNALELEEIGFNMVKMSGAYLVNDELPFLVMQARDFVGYDRLTESERKIFDKQFEDQRQLAERNGWVSDDFDKYKQFNCGFDRKRQEIVFYDFTDWRKI